LKIENWFANGDEWRTSEREFLPPSFKRG
jgi:hypothetical protein